MSICNADPLVGIIQSNENYLRLKTLINHAGHGLYIKLLCDSNYGGFSSDSEDIYQHLLKYKSEIDSLKDRGDISDDEYLLIYPSTEETNFKDFSLSLLHKLSEICVQNFPNVNNKDVLTVENCEKRTENNVDQIAFNTNDDASVSLDLSNDSSHTELDKIRYFDLLERFQDLARDWNMKGQVNTSESHFNSKWNEIISLLSCLDYDIQKVDMIRTAENLDACRKYRPALIRGQSELLLSECKNNLKMTEVNMITLGRLLNNLKEALALAKEENIEQISPFQEMKELRESIEISSKMLTTAEEKIKVLFDDMKFWKDKNVEGDIIIIDEMLSKLSAQVRKQSRSVSDYFNAVSFEIVKIKEKVNYDDDNIRYLKQSENAGKEKNISIGFVNIGI